MTSTVTRNFGHLRDLKLIPDTLLRDLGTYALSQIRRRTMAGVSAIGAVFAPLSPAYAKAKQKGVGSTRADLTVSGRMLQDMGILTVERTRITLGFRSRGGRATGHTFIQRSRSVGAADKAFWHHESGAGKRRVKRRFFDLSEADLTAIQHQVDRAIAEAIARSG